MLFEVHIENLAVLDRLDIEFSKGFTALTGETGAGKSLLVTALDLIAGGRASSDLIRRGAERATIEARLQLQSAEAIAALIEQGYDAQESLVIRRILQNDGNHRIFLNGKLASAQLLQEWVAPELEIHAQHAQQQLLKSHTQLALLDRFAATDPEIKQVKATWQALKNTQQEIDHLEVKASNRPKEIDYLKFQIENFERINPQPDELENLRSAIEQQTHWATQAQHYEKLNTLLSDGDTPVLAQLYPAATILQKLAEQNPDIQPLQEQFDQAVQHIQDIIRQLSRLRPTTDSTNEDLGSLEQLEARKRDIERLAHKHGGDLAAAIAAHHQQRAQLSELEQIEDKLVQLKQVYQKQEAIYLTAAKALSKKRQIAAKELSHDIEKQLAAMEMPHARFAIAGWELGKPASTGIDQIEFQLAANPGDEPRAIKKVASGGELSRILLAIQVVIGLEYPHATVIFDEADTGIGGQTASIVGKNMRVLGHTFQVLTVTHTPQVAATAHNHIHLSKEVVANRAQTKARVLTEQERVEELARMLGMKETTSALEHAQTLLRNAPT